MQNLPNWAYLAGAVVVLMIASWLLYKVRSGLIEAYNIASSAFQWLIVALTWFGQGLLGLFFYMLPGLTQPLAGGLPDSIWKWVAMGVVVGVFWLVIIQLLSANNPALKLGDLVSDFLASAIWAMVFAGVMGTYWSGGVPIWLALATGFAVADLVFGTILALRNAYAKNPGEMRTV